MTSARADIIDYTIKCTLRMVKCTPDHNDVSASHKEYVNDSKQLRFRPGDDCSTNFDSATDLVSLSLLFIEAVECQVSSNLFFIQAVKYYAQFT